MSPSASKVSLAAALRCLMMLIVSVFSKISFSCSLRIARAKRNKTLGPSSKKQSHIRRRVWKKKFILNFMKTLWHFEYTTTGEVKPLYLQNTGNQHLIIWHLQEPLGCERLSLPTIGCMYRHICPMWLNLLSWKCVVENHFETVDLWNKVGVNRKVGLQNLALQRKILMINVMVLIRYCWHS